MFDAMAVMTNEQRVRFFDNYRVACEHNCASEWQGFARAGQIIDAIKAVRRSVNLGLKDAKDVVEYFLNNGKTQTSKQWVFTDPRDVNKTVRVTQGDNGMFTVAVTRTYQSSDLGLIMRSLIKDC